MMPMSMVSTPPHTQQDSLCGNADVYNKYTDTCTSPVTDMWQIKRLCICNPEELKTRMPERLPKLTWWANSELPIKILRQCYNYKTTERLSKFTRAILHEPGQHGYWCSPFAIYKLLSDIPVRQPYSSCEGSYSVKLGECTFSLLCLLSMSKCISRVTAASQPQLGVTTAWINASTNDLFSNV